MNVNTFFFFPFHKNVNKYSVDVTIIEGTVTFLFCEKTFGGEYLQWKDKQVESPPREDLGRKKCLDRTDCIMQNYQQPT